MRKKATRKQPYFTMESAMTAILRNASGKMHDGILFGFKIDWDKAVGPCWRLTFLGIGSGIQRRQLTLPEHKLCELRLLLRETTAKRSIAKRHVESLAGKLNFTARVVFGGQTFLRRMIDTVNHVRHPTIMSRSTLNQRSDIDWWTDLFDGKTSSVDS